jgi:hypothetical protein
VALPGRAATQLARPVVPAHRNAALQQESTNLIDDAGALAGQPVPHLVQRLQVELTAVFVATNFIIGRCTASAITSASQKSFFCPLE